MISFLELTTTMLTLAIANGDSSWREWHSQRLRDTPHADLQRSLGLHMDIRNLIETANVDGNSRKKGLQAVERHREAIEKLRNLHLGGTDITEHVNMLHYTENYAKEYYHKLMGLDMVPVPDHPSEDTLASALNDATGIDASDTSDGDAELFRIMTRHWEHQPPPQTLGVSAKFHKDGRIERQRYHVALHLPCEIEWDGEKLRSSSKAAAFALKAPPLVHKWIEKITGLPAGRIQSIGFGLAVLGDGSRAGKIYVVNPGGSPMPHLPLGGDKVLKDSLPNVGVKLDANMVSLEWFAGDDKVALRYYALEKGESHEKRIYDWAGRNPAGESLVDVLRVAKSGTENVKVTPFFTENEVEVQQRAPEIAQVKLGLRLSDDYLADERFLMLSKPLLKSLGIDSHGVQQWVKGSSKITHTVSNWQAGDSHITFYRHPLDECSVRHRVNVRKGRRLTVDSACVSAQEAFSANMWAGACSSAHSQSSSACDTCMSSKSSSYDGACYTECKDSWTKPCDSSCTAAINNVLTACGNCHKTQTWCGKKGETIGSTTLPTSWPEAACTSCSNASSYCDDQHVCPQWMKDNYPAATFEKNFLDADMIAMVEGSLAGVPMNCKYPIYPWYGNKFPLCDQCESVYGVQHQMFIWGGPCSYTKPCESLSGDQNARKACAATTKGYKCGCDCGAVLSAVDKKCKVGQSLCPADLPSRCQTGDGDVYNNCEYSTYQGQCSGNLWSLEMTQCYNNGVWPTKCHADKQFTDKQIMFWLKEIGQLQNADSAPASAFASSIQSSEERDVTYGGSPTMCGASGAVTQYWSCTAFLAVLSACILT